MRQDSGDLPPLAPSPDSARALPFGCGTKGVNTNGAAAKVNDFDRLGKKVRPGPFGNIKVG